MFDGAASRWRTGGPMVEARRGHQAVLLDDGRVLAAGDVAAGRALATAEVYDTTSGTWSVTGAMASPRLGHSLSVLPGGRVLAAGGTSLDGATAGQPLVPVATTEVYDPAAGTWSPGPAMTTDRFEQTATRLADGRVLLVGGLDLPSTEGRFAANDPAQLLRSSPCHRAAGARGRTRRRSPCRGPGAAAGLARR